ncbi:alpha-crystallin B chain-like [Conger conger]|nr:alpha-crystallin B chain-like [Conger conger]
MEIPIQYPWFRRPAIPSFCPSRIFNQHFGEIVPEDDSPSFPSVYLPRLPLLGLGSWVDSGISEMKLDRDRFIINLDVKHFSPEELRVKINGEFIKIHGKHEDQLDEHGSVSREFVRRYKLPVGVDPGSVTSSLSSTGVLTVSAPRKNADLPERTIAITQEKK